MSAENLENLERTENTELEKSGGSKVVSVIISVILWIVILLAALFAFVTLATKNVDNVASIGGITPLTVQSDSMKPTFNKGDVIFVRKCDTEKLEVGDIITFRTIIDNKLVLNTHRIKNIEEDHGVRVFTTQGDNNNGLADEHKIVGGDIIGKYFLKLSGFGKIINFLSSKIGFLVVIVLPLLIFFIYQVYHLVMISAEIKKANAIEAAIQAEEIKQNMADADAEKKADETEVAEAEKAADNTATKTAEQMQQEAEAALAEARRMKEEAEAALAKAKELNENK